LHPLQLAFAGIGLMLRHASSDPGLEVRG
jgi:hypothetical protein